MKSRILLICVLITLALSNLNCGTRVATAVYPAQNPVVDVGFFYDELGPYGRWFQVDEWGWVWTPYGVPFGWRPYTHGYWVFTEYGWTWVSQWRWGWAPFHYGRWNYHPRYGWIWIPGTVWGPAWVVWRHRPGWVGWAPLPPRAGWHAGVGLEIGHAEIERTVEPHWYSFVEERQFTSPSLRRHIEVPARNVTLLQNTQTITSYTTVENRIVNRGIDVERIERDTGQKVRRLRLVDGGSARSDQVRGNDVVVFRPKVERKEKEGAPRVAESRAQTEELTRRQEKERRRLEAEAAAQQTRLEKQQRKEQRRIEEEQRRQQKLERKQRRTEKPPDAISPEQLESQQKAERRAMKEERQREEQVLRNRQESEMRRAQPPAAPPKEKKAKKKP